MQFLQWIGDGIRWLEDTWPIRLLSMLSSAATVFVVIVVPLYIWLVTRSTLPRFSKGDGQPLYLGIEHCEAPERFHLKGNLIGATGIIVGMDAEPRTIELAGFPFAVRSRVICQLAPDEKPNVDLLELAFVFGMAMDELVQRGARAEIILTNCRVRRPSLADRVRHWLINGPIGGPLRHWYYFGLP